MRNPSAFTFETDLATGNVKEGETYQCKHCQRHTHIKPFQRPEDIGGLCRRCMKVMCPRCSDLAAKGVACLPFEQRQINDIERAIERRRARESYGHPG